MWGIQYVEEVDRVSMKWVLRILKKGKGYSIVPGLHQPEGQMRAAKMVVRNKGASRGVMSCT